MPKRNYKLETFRYMLFRKALATEIILAIM